jgi:DNA-binding transcriptional regulator of glucitol operon
MRRRWFSRRAIVLHLALILWVPGCLAAGWWQATVALAGNSLSYLYAVEWPVFAIFGTVVWWNFIHDDPETVGIRGLRRKVSAASSTSATEGASDPEGTSAEVVSLRAADEDADLAAYNEYLAGLAAESRPKTWRK